jgi:predicted RNA binding protein YcfA (HicA-like mRNA interferase family)
MDRNKLLRKLRASSKNVHFSDLTSLLNSFGFVLDRVSGSHHIYVHPKIKGIVNVQNCRGKAKPYQVNQILKLIEKYGIN